MTDDDLITLAAQHGCLRPAYTRQAHPGLFQCWEDRALAVITWLSDSSRVIDTPRGHLVQEADRYSGQPLDLPRTAPAYRPSL